MSATCRCEPVDKRIAIPDAPTVCGLFSGDADFFRCRMLTLCDRFVISRKLTKERVRSGLSSLDSRLRFLVVSVSVRTAAADADFECLGFNLQHLQTNFVMSTCNINVYNMSKRQHQFSASLDWLLNLKVEDEEEILRRCL
ncbi:hypothetical protein MA16_Dca001172 [Dendrobium catenatum]|uniref:Uncharacterized protein n=1 Tax=Dendrobium catenatum TaxID=906689 RepID=A0A2I0WLP3_9ASPA|nr:hypothetical protein MA16_Dca001172 [Dendrobium catenatum]